MTNADVVLKHPKSTCLFILDTEVFENQHLWKERKFLQNALNYDDHNIQNTKEL